MTASRMTAPRCSRRHWVLLCAALWSHRRRAKNGLMPARRQRPDHALVDLSRDLSYRACQLHNWLEGAPITIADAADFKRPMQRILAALDAKRAQLLSQRERTVDEKLR